CGAGFVEIALAAPGRPAPRSQGCEVARVLTALDTKGGNKFPRAGNGVFSRPGKKLLEPLFPLGVSTVLGGLSQEALRESWNSSTSYFYMNGLGNTVS